MFCGYCFIIVLILYQQLSLTQLLSNVNIVPFIFNALFKLKSFFKLLGQILFIGFLYIYGIIFGKELKYLCIVYAF